MERKIILASHGRFASGILDSLEIIFGNKHPITALDCYLSESFDLTESVKRLLDENQGKEIIVITDLFGGSVNNEFLQYIDQAKFYLIAGLNLPLLIELTAQIEQAESIPQLIADTLRSSKETIQFCNDSINKEIEEEEF